MILTKSNIQRQIGKYVSEMRMQIHPENDANSNARLRKANTHADRNGRKEVAPTDRSPDCRL